MIDLRAHVMAAYQADLCVLPPKEDGTKGPDASRWKHYESERPTLAELEVWYQNGRTGMGIICGAVSGNLEAFEFDDPPVYQAYKELAAASGLAGLVERIEAGYSEQSPSGGIHWLYQCPEIGGNTKLARRPKRPEEMAHPGDKIKVLIETRGEGGYIITAPSYGNVHPSGRPYVLLNGSFGSVITLTPAERTALFELASSFDQMPKPTAQEPLVQKPDASGRRPGDDFNLRGSWAEILEPHGWRHVYEYNGTSYWRRPGKESGASATTNWQGSDLFYMFSTSTIFEPGRGYSKFSAFAMLDHNGNYQAAAKALVGAGYGEPSFSSNGSGAPGDHPVVQVNNRFLRDIAADSVRVLESSNSPPYLFSRGSELVRLAEGSLAAEALSLAALKGLLDRCADFVRVKRGETGEDVLIPARPPEDLVKDILSQQRLPFPALKGFASTPIFLPGGRLLACDGHDPESGIYLKLGGLQDLNWDMPLEEAKALLLDELLVDFPFADEASRAHTLAALLLPFLRQMIPGPTPLHLFDAPARGTGNGLLG